MTTTPLEGVIRETKVWPPRWLVGGLVHALETTLRQITGQSDAYGDAVADLLAAYFRDSPSGVAVLHSVLGKVHRPASSSGCPVTGSKKSMPLDTSACPAFTDGCPYKGVSQMSKEQLAKCPAFVDGCPFKADTTLEAFVSRLEGMKASPAIAKCPAFKDGGCPFSEMLAKDKVHRAACCTRCCAVVLPSPAGGLWSLSNYLRIGSPTLDVMCSIS